MALTDMARITKSLPFKGSLREKRFLVIGGVLTVIILLYSLGLDPFLKKQENVKKELSQKQKTLFISQRNAGRRRPLERKVNALQTNLKEMEKGLLDTNNPSLAAANIQEIIKGISLKTGISINSVRVMPPNPADAYTEIPVRIETTGNISTLKNLLFEIESLPKLLLIKEVNINVQTWAPVRRPPMSNMPRRADGRVVVAPPPAPRPSTDFRTGLVICGYIKTPVVSKTTQTAGTQKRTFSDSE